jgi:hypothetical protein
MPNSQIGWSRVNLPAHMDSSKIAAVLRPDEKLTGFDMLPYRQWCTEVLGEEGTEWGMVNQFGVEIWFRFHGSVTLFMLNWHRQDKPVLANARIRFLPSSESSVEWVDLSEIRREQSNAAARSEPTSFHME